MSPTKERIDEAFAKIPELALCDGMLAGRLQQELDVLRAALAAAQPASECPACGWQNDREALDCEAAYERAAGRKLEPGDREFLTFRAGWIAGHTRAAQPKAPSLSEDRLDPFDAHFGPAPSPTPGEVESGSPMNAGSLATVSYTHLTLPTILLV